MFPTISIAGAPFERGRQYGRQAAALIRHSIASYARMFAFYGLDWQAVQQRAEPFAPVIAAFDADLLEEIQGIAEGSGRAPAEILALNARTELLPPSLAVASPAWEGAAARNRAAGVPEHGECTAVAVLPAASADGATRLAQTWDWTGDQRAACVLLRVESPGRPALLTLTEAGILAKIGLNAAGLGVCLNILRTPLDGQRPGVPVHVLLRAVLGEPDVAAALRRVAGAAVGGSSNLLCADAGGQAASMELTPAAQATLTPTDGLLIHTNHCVAPATSQAAGALDTLLTSRPRYSRAEQILRPQIGSIDRAALVALLRDEAPGDAAICRRPDPRLPAPARVETVAAVVMELAERTIHLAPDIPADVAFTPVRLAE
ncbi:MAG TPA: C45 family peptidase [Roseiflexaceae bacterium]|nr:C45 family peptidase [Roseiflexaceae bacterium]